jgi:hypothetical protein
MPPVAAKECPRHADARINPNEPNVTLQKGSEDGWLFVSLKVEGGGATSAYGGWQKLRKDSAPRPRNWL